MIPGTGTNRYAHGPNSTALFAAISSCFVDAHRPRAVRFLRSPASQVSSEAHRLPPAQVRGSSGGHHRAPTRAGVHPDHPHRAGHRQGRVPMRRCSSRADASPRRGLTLIGCGNAVLEHST